ncbi:MAG TPA: MarR family transcriptional regulator [Stellaceae bacterium]|jgi:DNA-binding MarR family transcriptional regulator|nr:MarR family transcriptional regulator [Stellaceae bacterium]
MNPNPYERRFGFLLHDIARLMRKRFDARTRTSGLTRAQWQVLLTLTRQEGVNQAALAETLDLEPITVGRLIDRMQEAGWVERRPDAADRRAHRLYITARARPMMIQLETVGNVLLDEAFSGLTQDERDGLLDLLVRIRGNLSERGVRAGELVDTES